VKTTSLPNLAWMAGIVAFGLVPARAWAQAPSHKHYEKSPEAEKPSATGELAPRLQNLGTHTFAVTTRSKKAQAFVNQGVNLAYGFNHVEAGRAFREAARLDPNCAMAYWGQALVLGPNINLPMAPEDEPKAHELAQRAVAMKAKATPRERAYIDAVATRYSGKPEERSARDGAYADAMRDLSKRYPADLDAATLFAEALMDLRPWAYWAPDGTPYPGTTEALAALERVFAKKPAHPGANHYYIHLVEATKNPEKAEAAADRLRTLMPGAGHMVHMPGHIYMRVGRYADASAVNDAAIVADEDYIAQCRAQGIYPIGYYPHNIHFLWASATMEGRSETAIAAARKVAARVTDENMDQLPLLAGFKIVPYYALSRFGRWDEVLKEPAPPERFVYVKGTWHYARGLAFVGKGQLDEAEKELVEVRRIAGGKALEFTLFSPNTAASIYAIAPETLAAVIAIAKKDFDRAIPHLELAVRLDDGLVYTEPAEWHYPPRGLLAAALLKAGRPREAETVYWDDLKRNAENGWSLFGLSQALAAQGRKDEAAAVEARFRKAWAKADVTLQASVF
jgi:tetratricopeptide (TPR) repeat protein